MKAANLLINNKGQLQIADFGLARPFHDPGTAWEGNGWKGGSTGYTSMVVTRWYRPPELLAGDRRYGPPIDMWGLGCILAEMISRKPIFKGSSEIEQMDLIAQLCGSPNEETYPGWNALPGVKNADPNPRSDQEPDPPGRHNFGSYPRKVKQYFTIEAFSVRDELAELLDNLLVLDPCKRFTAKQALEHKWFWQPPFPADPSALPSYQASKELDRQRRDQLIHQQQQRAAQAHYQQQQQIMAMSRPPPPGRPMGNNNYQGGPRNGHHHGRPNGYSGGHNNPPPPHHHQRLPHASVIYGSTRPVPRMSLSAQQGRAPTSNPGNNQHNSSTFNPYDLQY